MRETNLLADAQRLQALAQAGIAYATSAYDLERYEEIRRLSVKLLAEITDEPYDRIIQVFASETGYQTPKVDIRAVLLWDDRMLLVREKIDGNRWTLPGGWADVGSTPFEVAEKEVAEEAGLRVRAARLLALLDKRNHAHPPQPWYVYKAFILCEVEGGELAQETAETAGANWFRRDQLPGQLLSTDRVTLSQLETMFRLAADPALPVLCD